MDWNRQADISFADENLIKFAGAKLRKIAQKTKSQSENPKRKTLFHRPDPEPDEGEGYGTGTRMPLLNKLRILSSELRA